MLKITNILNPLTGGSTIEEYTWVSGKPLSEYIDYDGECIVTHNHELIDLPLGNIYPADTDEYEIMAIPEGGDRQTQRILGLTAMGVVTFIPGWGPAAAWIGSNLINLFLRDKGKDQPTSQSYAWQHQSSPRASHGAAMPVIYGKARVRPVLKNRYVTVKDDKQYLYALYGIAAHKVDVRTGLPDPGDFPLANNTEFEWSVTPGETFLYKDPIPDSGYPLGFGTASFYNDIIINGRAIQDYNKDVEWETRPGLPEQNVIIGFDVTYSNFTQNTTLYLDQPEINHKTVTIRYSDPSSKVVWLQHYLLLHGSSFVIQSDAESFAPGVTYYVYYDQTISTRKYYLKANAPPTASTAYLIARFTGQASGITTPIYYYPTNLPTSDDWYIPVITLTALHNIELMFEFPSGLFGDIVGGSITSATCRIFAQYREYSEDDTGKWLNFSSGFSDPDHSIPYDDTDIGAIAITRTKPEAFNISIKAVTKIEALNYGKTYEVRVTASSPSIVKLVNIATIVYGAENTGTRLSPGFTYPGEPLLGIKALASGQISGDLDVQVDVERSKVWVFNDTHYSPGQWVLGDANIHAWAVYDILANGHPDHPAYPTAGNDDAEAIYGCGIDKDRLDHASFLEWAEHTGFEGLNYELNIVFDSFMTAWDAILRICQEGRGMIYPVGTKIFAFTDKAEDATQLFTMGNIHLDTFVQKYMESSQKINMVEVNYYDRERNYEKTTIAARTADWDSGTGLSVPTIVTLYGTTTFEQAWSIARFILRGNELLNNIISFGVDIDALAAQAGNVVDIDHDILNIGNSGRIISYNAGTKTVTLDRTVVSVPGYVLKVKHSNGTIETKATTTSGSTITLVFGSAWTDDPATYELYSFGEISTHVKQFRIANISRTNELMRTLTLVQYDSDLYDSYVPSDSLPSSEDGEFTASKIAVSNTTVETVANLLNLATNLQLREVLSKNRVTGEIESSIVATWDPVDGDRGGEWEVYFRDVDASDVDWQGTWEDGTYDLDDKVESDGKTYISLEDDNTSIPFIR